jgi:hypothetical protein
MATPTDQIAIWILEAAEVEALREPDMVKRRTDAYVLGEVMMAHKLEGGDIDRGRGFLAERFLINAVGVDGGTLTYALPAGSEHLAAHRSKEAQAIATKHAKNEWTLDRRMTMIGLIWAVSLVGVGLLVRWLLR